MKKYLTQKNLLIAIVLLIGVAACIIVYRLMQFKSKDVAVYIDEAASQYPDKEIAFKLIQDGVEHILASHNLSQQVLKSAAASKVPKEQELVHAALMQCKSFGYLE
jgi:hypothetical protein